MAIACLLPMMSRIGSMLASDGWIDSTSGEDTMQKAEKWARVQEMSSGVVGGQPEVWEEQPRRPTCTGWITSLAKVEVRSLIVGRRSKVEA